MLMQLQLWKFLFESSFAILFYVLCVDLSHEVSFKQGKYLYKELHVYIVKLYIDFIFVDDIVGYVQAICAIVHIAFKYADRLLMCYVDSLSFEFWLTVLLVLQYVTCYVILVCLATKEYFALKS